MANNGFELSSDLFSCVVEVYDNANNKQITKDDLLQWCKNAEIIKNYHIIVHDKDYDNNGVKERPHIHILIVLNAKRTKESVICAISSYLLCDRNIVSVRVQSDYLHCLRYLTHKDDKTKYQYDDTEVLSCNPSEYYDTIESNIDPYVLNYDTLYSICKRFRNATQVYGLIGLKNAQKYRLIIKDIIESFDKVRGE